jgi:hypothetical protein
MLRRTFIAGAAATSTVALYGCKQEELVAGVSFGLCAPEDDPGTIFGSLGPRFAQWLRGTDVLLFGGGTVSQVRDLSGCSRHEVFPSGGPGAVYVASDAGFSGQPAWKYDATPNGYSTVSDWARAAPLTTPYWVRLVMRQETSIANKVIVGDLTVGAFVVRQENNLGKLGMRNPSVANLNGAAGIGAVCVVEAYFSGQSGSSSHDYLRVKSVVAKAQAAGNSAGTAEWMGASWNGTSVLNRAVYTCADKVVVLGGVPTLDMLARDSAYCANRYGTGVL